MEGRMGRGKPPLLLRLNNEWLFTVHYHNPVTHILVFSPFYKWIPGWMATQLSDELFISRSNMWQNVGLLYTRIYIIWSVIIWYGLQPNTWIDSMGDGDMKLPPVVLDLWWLIHIYQSYAPGDGYCPWKRLQGVLPTDWWKVSLTFKLKGDSQSANTKNQSWADREILVEPYHGCFAFGMVLRWTKTRDKRLLI